MFKAIFGLSFMGATFAALLLTTCEQSTPIYEESTYALERTIGRDVYTLDSGLTLRDCVDVLPVDSSYECKRERAQLRGKQ